MKPSKLKLSLTVTINKQKLNIFAIFILISLF
jgi:hypothetical protein